MNKKRLTKIIVSIVGSVIIVAVLILIGLGFKNIELDELGIDYNMITGNYSEELTPPGIKYIGVSNEFLKVKTSSQAINFVGLRCLSSDFVAVTLSVEVTYRITFRDVTNITNYIILFGFEPESILTPIFRNQIQKIVSTYDISTLSPFDIDSFQSGLRTSIISTLAPMVAMDINVTLQTITANYQNEANSGYIAQLKQQISKYRTDLASSGSGVPVDYVYMVQRLLESTKGSLDNLITAEKSRLALARAWINTTVIADKWRNYVESGNQSFYQDVVAPDFVRDGNFA